VPTYSEAFKSKMVQRMLGPQARSAISLSGETGVSQTSLSKWLREAKVRPMADEQKPRKREKRPEDWTAAEKLSAVMEASRLSDAELGEFLRRNGLHEAQLTQWRQSALEGLGGGAKPSRASSESRRVRELEKEVLRKDKALAEAAALLVLQKKVRTIWGDGDDDTEPASEK
jgi:transposase-like protein